MFRGAYSGKLVSNTLVGQFPAKGKWLRSSEQSAGRGGLALVPPQPSGWNDSGCQQAQAGGPALTVRGRIAGA